MYLFTDFVQNIPLHNMKYRIGTVLADIFLPNTDVDCVGLVFRWYLNTMLQSLIFASFYFNAKQVIDYYGELLFKVQKVIL